MWMLFILLHWLNTLVIQRINLLKRTALRLISYLKRKYLCNTHIKCVYINTGLISPIMTVIAGCIQYCDMHLSTLSHVW